MRLSRSATTNRHEHKVLVVDDDADLRATTELRLRAEGYDVRVAGDAVAAVDAVRRWTPDLVLLDYYLGGATGADVVRELRTFDRLVQVLLVTGYAAEQPARRLLEELDVQGYHDKADGGERMLVLVQAALKHRRVLLEVERQNRYLREILDAGPEIMRLQPARDLLLASLRRVVRILGSSDGLVATCNSGLLVLDDAREGVSIHAGTGDFAGWTGLSELSVDVAGAVRAGLAGEVPRHLDPGFVNVPLSTTTGVRGCIVVRAPSLPPEAVAPVEIFGRQIMQALENVLLYERATVDPLTRLFNRGFAEQRLEQALKLGARSNAPTAVLMLDVDHFKAINDRHGHAAGDLVLRTLAAVLVDTCRATDVACRWGGEELVVVLPATDGTHAALLAERVRLAIEATVVPFEHHRLRCTVSVGVAWSSPGDEAGDDLLRRADEALYRAKASGRNTIGGLECLGAAA
jgi:diguanylate cyclase (GGDEF)-like protein